MVKADLHLMVHSNDHTIRPRPYYCYVNEKFRKTTDLVEKISPGSGNGFYSRANKMYENSSLRYSTPFVHITIDRLFASSAQSSGGRPL